jgi:hypothetical protein
MISLKFVSIKKFLIGCKIVIFVFSLILATVQFFYWAPADVGLPAI